MEDKEKMLKENEQLRKKGKYNRKIERAVSISINALEELENKKELTPEEVQKKAIAKEIIKTWLKYKQNNQEEQEKEEER